jgi:hypothetical protein
MADDAGGQEVASVVSVDVWRMELFSFHGSISA